MCLDFFDAAVVYKTSGNYPAPNLDQSIDDYLRVKRLARDFGCHFGCIMVPTLINDL